MRHVRKNSNRSHKYASKALHHIPSFYCLSYGKSTTRSRCYIASRIESAQRYEEKQHLLNKVNSTNFIFYHSKQDIHEAYKLFLHNVHIFNLLRWTMHVHISAHQIECL